MDTVTLVRSAIRGLLRRGAAELGARAAGGAAGATTTTPAAGKPVVDWDDAAARAALVDALARDGDAVLAVLDGRDLARAGRAGRRAAGHACWVRTSNADPDGRVPDRPAGRARTGSSRTVDPEARHGHKTAAHSFDGYKGHVALDPDSRAHHRDRGHRRQHRRRRRRSRTCSRRPAASADDRGRRRAEHGRERAAGVYGDAAYGTGEVLASCEAAGAEPVQGPAADRGAAASSPRTHFAIDLAARP